jgi:hypothetical protein
MPEWGWEDQGGVKGAQNLSMGIAAMMNDEEFSDVTFIVEGKPFYAHKSIISILSEKYRAMFKAGMMESQSNKSVIQIDHISYPVFELVMRYLYTGSFEPSLEFLQNIEVMVDILRVADEEFLDEIKFKCEQQLTLLV